MNYRNKLMSLSLVALAAFSACTNEVENSGNEAQDGSLMTFTVDMQSPSRWQNGKATRAASGSEAVAKTYAPIEMGQVDGQAVYLTTEVTEGLPGDDKPLSRGTMVNSINRLESFGVSATTTYYTGQFDYMDKVKVTPNYDHSVWTPEGKWYNPFFYGLYFVFWAPYEAEGLNVEYVADGNPRLNYEVPDDVTKQVPLFTASGSNGMMNNTKPIEAKLSPANTAVRFVVGDDLPECTIKSISIQGVQYKGYIPLDNNACNPHLFTWQVETSKVKDFTLTLNKKVDGTKDSEITGDDQVFFMLPQQLAYNKNAGIEVVLNNGIQDITMRAKFSDMASGGIMLWNAGYTYTFRISSSVVSANVTFFKGTNGLDGNPYTSHNISANGDPFTVDLWYPATVTSIKARLAYETTDGSGNTTYEPFQENLDLTGKTTADFTSLCMNNMGDPSKGKKAETPFVVQIQITNPVSLIMPSDPDNPDTKQTYNPSNGTNQWFTVWRGTMFPPNYILEKGTFTSYIGRKNLLYNNSTQANLTNMNTAVGAYWEVDENHPTLGKGKWGLPSGGSPKSSYVFSDADNLCETVTYELMKWSYRGASPGENDLYGEPFVQKGFYWTNGGNGGGNYWVICGQNDTNHSSWYFIGHNCPSFKRIDYQMTSVSYANGGVCGRGFADTNRK